MDEEERKTQILQDLKKNGESSITDIARRINMSQATVSKYLGLLKAETKVTIRNVPPRKYFIIKE